jgi:hypothetical protein
MAKESTVPDVVTTEYGDTLSLEINAINLSEDMSVVSTKNDEILILLYEKSDSTTLSKPLFSKQLIFDQKSSKRQFHFPVSDNQANTALLLFFIELDYGTTAEQIDPVIRIHYKTIVEAYTNKDRSTIQNYLGSEDLLGVQQITELPTEFIFNGTYKLDRYEYLLNIKHKKTS